MKNRLKTSLLLGLSSITIFSAAASDSSSSGFAQVSYHNPHLEKLSGGASGFSTLEKVEKLEKTLKQEGTLTLKRFQSGGGSAVTVLPGKESTYESAVGGLLIMQWDRDNAIQCLAERLQSQDCFNQGLQSSLKHHFIYRKRFLDYIDKKVSPSDSQMNRPHIRYNPVSLEELRELWGHAQNDALSLIGFDLFYDANENKRKLRDAFELSYAVLLPHYFKAIGVENDLDTGAWEDKRAVHASSLALVLLYLRESYEYVTRFGAIKYKIDGRSFVVDEALLRELIGKVSQSLYQILPDEYVVCDQSDTRSDTSKNRKYDSALVNALFVQTLCPRPYLIGLRDEKVSSAVKQDKEMKHLRIFTAAEVAALASRLESNLMGANGFARYPGDIWDGREDRKDIKGKEAQWCHVSPLLACVYGDLYRRTGDKAYFDRQVFHFNRGIAHIDSDFLLPEAYIVDKQSGKWVADANKPLAWGQSALLLSIDSMKQSLSLSKDKAKNKEDKQADGGG